MNTFLTYLAFSIYSVPLPGFSSSDTLIVCIFFAYLQYFSFSLEYHGWEPHGLECCNLFSLCWQLLALSWYWEVKTPSHFNCCSQIGLLCFLANSCCLFWAYSVLSSVKCSLIEYLFFCPRRHYCVGLLAIGSLYSGICWRYFVI